MYTSKTCNITCYFQYIHVCTGRFTDGSTAGTGRSLLAATLTEPALQPQFSRTAALLTVTEVLSTKLQILPLRNS
jgi:hypothetical protein